MGGGLHMGSNRLVVREFTGAGCFRKKVHHKCKECGIAFVLGELVVSKRNNKVHVYHKACAERLRVI